MGNILCCSLSRAKRKELLEEKAQSLGYKRTWTEDPPGPQDLLYTRNPLLDMEPTKKPFPITITLAGGNAPREFQQIRALIDTGASVNVISKELVERLQIPVEEDEGVLHSIEKLNKQPYHVAAYFHAQWRLPEAPPGYPGIFAVLLDADAIPPDIDVLLEPVEHTDHVGSAAGESTTHALQFHPDMAKWLKNGGREENLKEYHQPNGGAAHPTTQQDQQVQIQQANSQPRNPKKP